MLNGEHASSEDKEREIAREMPQRALSDTREATRSPRVWLMVLAVVVVGSLLVVYMWRYSSDTTSSEPIRSAAEILADRGIDEATLSAIELALSVAGGRPDLAEEIRQTVQTAFESHDLTEEEAAVVWESMMPQLEYRSFGLGTEYGMAVLRGEVTNVSSDPLDVRVVVTFTDLLSPVVRSEARIDDTPLFPGRTSPFSVTTRPNSAIKGAQIEFYNVLSGEEIRAASIRER